MTGESGKKTYNHPHQRKRKEKKLNKSTRNCKLLKNILFDLRFNNIFLGKNQPKKTQKKKRKYGCLT